MNPVACRGLPPGLTVLVAVALAAACAPHPPEGPAGGSRPAPELPAAGRISLERGPCFGSCPVYTVSVDRSGAVRFEGRRFVADTGVSTASVPPARVDSLLAQLEAGGFFGFADRYDMGEPGCERYATDLPTAIIEVSAGGRTKRVEHDYGCMGAPEALSAMERRIDAVAGVERWVGN